MVSIVFETSEPEIIPTGIMARAMALGEVLIQDENLINIYSSNVADFELASYNAAADNEFTVKYIRNKKEMEAYCCVYPAEDPKGVYINPTLLVNMARDLKTLYSKRSADAAATSSSEAPSGETDLSSSGATSRKRDRTSSCNDESAVAGIVTPLEKVDKPRAAEELEDTIVLFLGVKIAHEVWHLLHRSCSKTVRTTGLTPPRVKTDRVKEYKEPIQVMYDDMGTIMEHDALGGCWELTSADKAEFMQLDHIVIYPSINTKIGNLLDVASTRLVAGDLRVVLGSEYRSKKLPKFHSASLPGSSSRMSSSDGVDATSLVEESDAEDEESVRYPGYVRT